MHPPFDPRSTTREAIARCGLALVALALGLLGASAQAQPTPPAATASWRPPRELTRETFGGARCTAHEPVELGTSGVRTLRPTLSFSGVGEGLVAWPTGEDTLTVRPISLEGVGPAREVALEHAVGLAALGPAGPRGFIAHTMVPLCGGGLACSRSIALGLDGVPLGPADEPAPRDQLGTLSAATATTDALVLSRFFRYGGGIDLFRIGAGGAVELEPHPIRAATVDAAPIQALAADGAQVVAYGVEEDTERPFILALGGSRQYLRMMPAGSEVQRLTLEGTTATIVFRPPRLRPRWVRVSTTDGAIVEGPTTIEPSATLPSDLARVVVPTVAVTRGRLVLTRRDLAGGAIGEPFEIAPASGRPLVVQASSGGDLGVLWARREGRTWRLWLARVACSSVELRGAIAEPTQELRSLLESRHGSR